MVAVLLVKVAAAQHGKEIIHITTTSATDITGLAKNIAAQPGLKYSLNMQNASLRKKITLRPGNYTLSQVLEQVKKQAALQYKILGTHILFIDYSAAVTRSKPLPATVPSKVKHTVHRQLPPKAKPVIVARVKQEQPEVKREAASGDSVVALTPLGVNVAANGMANFLTARLKADSLRGRPSSLPAKNGMVQAGNEAAARERKFHWLQPVTEAGFTADELFYSGVQAQAGLHWLYAIAAFGTDYRHTQFRWGGGMSLPVTENGRLHLNFTTGASAAFYPRDTSVLLKDVWEKERLHRFGIAWSNRIGQRFKIQAQVHYNLLHQSFTATDTSSWDAFTGNFDERYRVFRPPYTISKSVGANTATKSWLGIQVTLFFHFL